MSRLSGIAWEIKETAYYVYREMLLELLLSLTMRFDGFETEEVSRSVVQLVFFCLPSSAVFLGPVAAARWTSSPACA